MHHWQDYVITTGLLSFAVALVPSLVGKHKPSLWTSLSTGVVAVVFSGTYLTLKLWFSAVMQMVMAIAWLTLAVQKYLQGRRAAKP